MLRIFILAFLLCSAALAQYEDYESYQTFTDLDKYQRDYGLVFTPSMMYTSVDEQNSATGATAFNRSRNLFFYDIHLGYIFRGGFYFGILYASELVDVDRDSPRNERESVGLSFGYYNMGWALRATFFPYSKQTLNGTTDISEYTTGMGFQADIAYYFRVGRFFSVGPQLVYKSINYRKAESVATSVNNDANSTHGVFTPMVALLFNLYRG